MGRPELDDVTEDIENQIESTVLWCGFHWVVPSRGTNGMQRYNDSEVHVATHPGIDRFICTAALSWEEVSTVSLSIACGTLRMTSSRLSGEAPCLATALPSS